MVAFIVLLGIVFGGVKLLAVANPKYIYSGTPEDYVNDCFELQTKGILVLI